MKVIENFLEDSFFQDLKKLVIESEFSWFKRKNMLKNKDDDLGYFTHSFFNNNTINCKYYNYNVYFIYNIWFKLFIKNESYYY